MNNMALVKFELCMCFTLILLEINVGCQNMIIIGSKSRIFHLTGLDWIKLKVKTLNNYVNRMKKKSVEAGPPLLMLGK